MGSVRTLSQTEIESAVNELIGAMDARLKREYGDRCVVASCPHRKTCADVVRLPKALGAQDDER